MTDHDQPDQPDDEEVTYLLDKLDEIRLGSFYEPVTDDDPADPTEVAALVSAVETAGGDPSTGRLRWRTTNKAVLGPDGEPVGIEQHRKLTFNNCPPRTP